MKPRGAAKAMAILAVALALFAALGAIGGQIGGAAPARHEIMLIF